MHVLYQRESALTEKPNAITANEQSPRRFEIPLNIIRHALQGRPNNIVNRSTLLPMLSSIKNINRSIDSLSENSSEPNDKISDTELEELNNLCKVYGIVGLGFTKLPRHLIFKDKAVLYDNAIVLLLEMDKDKIAKAPSRATVGMVMKTYNKLGIAANRVATFLRHHGYAAHASHPLGGAVLYPPLAAMAGLGWSGRHGLLITPQFGPRVRIAAVFTNISNLPFSRENPHGWIPRQCETCGNCIKKCPPKSLYEQPIPLENGLITHNDSEKCFSFFAANYGCSICIKVCPFSTIGYHKLYENVMQSRALKPSLFLA
jgi:ferredoxin